MKKHLLLFLVILVSLSSCKIFNPNLMLKAKKNREYSEIQDTIPIEYRIASGDILNFRIFSNDGFRIIDLTSFENSSRSDISFNTTTSLPYPVEFDGQARFPVIGRKMLSGLTKREAEKMLEKEYSKFYNDPYVLISIINKRVTVYPGNGGAATVVAMQNERMTVMEVLASAGGVSVQGKAYRIKLLRGEDQHNPEIFMLDMSKLDPALESNMLVQSGDIIYVESAIDVSEQIINDVSRIVGLLSSIIILTILLSN